MRLLLGCLFLASIVAGCAQQNLVWVKPNANESEFSNDKYQCMLNSQQRRSSSTYSNSGGYVSDSSFSLGRSVSEVVTNGDLFAACMNAKGWNLKDSKDLFKTQQASSSPDARDIELTSPDQGCKYYADMAYKANIENKDDQVKKYRAQLSECMRTFKIYIK